MKMKKIVKIIISVVAVCLMLGCVESAIASTLKSEGVENSDVAIGTFFLSAEQRKYIDNQRAIYLGKETKLGMKSHASEESKPKQKPEVRLPSALTVTSIIVSPEGKMIRINDQYIKHSKGEVKVVQSQTNANSASLLLNGKAIDVDVGETYLSKSGRTVKTYRLQKTSPNVKFKTIALPTKNYKPEQEINRLEKDLKTIQMLTGKLKP